MKFKLIVSLVLLISLNSFGQTSPEDFLPKNILKNYKKTVLNDFGVDSIYCFKFNETAGAIIDYQRTYNEELTPDGQVVREITENFVDGAWIKSRLLENTYFPSQEVDFQLIQTWNTTTNDWEGLERSTFRYNSNDLLTSLLVEKFNTQTGSWEFFTRNLFTYFNLTEPDEFLLQEWDGSDWKNNGQIFFSYNSNLQVTSSLFRLWDDNTNDWVNANQTFETYNSDFRQTRTERETWNRAASDWDNSTRSAYAYNQDNELDKVTNEIWVNNDSTWAFTDDNLYRYDFRKRNNEFIIRNYDGTNFNNFFRNKRTFDINDNIKKVENQFFQGGFWVIDNYCELFYSELQTSGLEDFTNNNQCNINKIGSTYSLDCQMLFTNQSQLYFEVFTLDGKLVFSEKVNSFSKINPNLKDGFYLVAFKNNNNVIASKKDFLTN